MAAKGGKREGAGRPKGARNKANAEIREAAQKYTKEGIKELAKLAGLIKDGSGNPIGAAQSEQARVACINSLLDRGHGKATQMVAGDAEADPISVNVNANPREELARRIAGVAARIGTGKTSK